MASTLSRADVERIAELARLALTTDEVELFTRQLGDILGYVEQIQTLDTTGVPPMSHVGTRPIERADAIAESLPRREALANAPEVAAEAGLFKVPRVL